jgi:hypothetical protein
MSWIVLKTWQRVLPVAGQGLAAIPPIVLKK